MPRFRFRLESVLRLRASQRDERREALSKAIEAEQILAKRVRNVEQEIEAARTRRRSRLECSVLDVDKLLRGDGHETTLRAQLQKLASQREQVLVELERRRAALIEADKQLKILEKLRERQHSAYLQKEARRETQFLDEVGGRSVPRS